ncbi:hypothetical protein K3495_g16449, partial [Podosphaera aphanis]
MVQMVKEHFETEQSRQEYMTMWRSTTLLNTIANNPEKSKLECLQLTIDRLQHIQQGLSEKYQFEHTLRDQVINACQGIKACNLALYKPANTFEGVCSELRSSIATYERSKSQHSSFASENDHDHHWTDRTYVGRGINQRQNNSHKLQESKTSRGSFPSDRRDFRKVNQQKRCFVCRKIGCWSTKHTSQDRRKAYEKFCQYADKSHLTNFDQFLFEFEGLDTGIDRSSDSEIQALIADLN